LEDNVVEPEIPEATLLGRWVPVGFETNVRYDFTSTDRFTTYGQDNVFPSMEEVIEAGTRKNPWVYEGEVVVIDLHFGNYSRLIPEFKCDNRVIEWTNEAGEFWGTFYREDHDISACD